MSFRVDLEVYRGPLDLLLYLVRKHEIPVSEIPLAAVVDQYLEHLEVLEKIDVNAVGEFIEVASMLVEIKSREALPRVEEDDGETPQDDPREQLVERLLEYKKFRDAASLLEEQAREAQLRYGRMANDLPPRRFDLADQPIGELELWDLVSAFGRLMRRNEASPSTNIVYDDTPITTYMQRIHRELVERGRASFSQMFAEGMHKSAMVGVFLAVLELVRHHSVRTEQEDLHGEIWLTPGEKFTSDINLQHVSSYEKPPAAEQDDEPGDEQEDEAPQMADEEI